MSHEQISLASLPQAVDKISAIIQRCSGGQIDRKRALRDTEKILRVQDSLAKVEEQARAKEHARATNEVKLTTDTQDAVSIHMLNKGVEFRTGYATACLAAAAVHPQKGVGASHHNLVGIDIIMRVVREVLEGKQALPESLHGILTPDDYTKTTSRVVTEAIHQLAVLEPTGIPLRGTRLYLLGAESAGQREKETILKATQSALRANQHFNDGKARGSQRVVDVNTDGLGRPCEAIVSGNPPVVRLVTYKNR